MDVLYPRIKILGFTAHFQQMEQNASKGQPITTRALRCQSS